MHERGPGAPPPGTKTAGGGRGGPGGEQNESKTGPIPTRGLQAGPNMHCTSGVVGRLPQA